MLSQAFPHNLSIVIVEPIPWYGFSEPGRFMSLDNSRIEIRKIEQLAITDAQRRREGVATA
jgi:hypothetical protein